MMTPKQERFVAEYLVDLNATAAYKRAGYAAKNDNAAAASASALLKNPKIAELVEAGKKAGVEKAELTRDWVLERLRHEAGLANEQGGTQSGRVQALNTLAKYFGLLEHPVKVEQVDRVEIVVEIVDDNRPPGLPAAPPPG